jgi:TetR/AcrR family transcriptional regulator, regulator of cefoperazone and chloramphenicol sensitivity
MTLSTSKEPSEGTKARVMEAAIELISSGKESFQSITIRKIALAAQVNVAAVNYHFGSKNNVLNGVLRFFLERLIEGLSSEERSPSTEARLRSFIQGYLSYTFSNLKFVREMIIHAILDSGEPNDALVGLLRDNGFQPFLSLLAELKPGVDPNRLRFAIVQIISSLLFPALEAGIIRHVVGIDFQDGKIVEEYGEFLLEGILSR